MQLLRNAVRPYAWGSRTAIAELLGRPEPAEHPEAELWMGAHPADPSFVVGADGVERSLLEVIENDPRGQLGATAERWAGQLPFLLKVLAAEEPLSIQAHPSAVQAAEGYAREEAAGVARDAPERNYPDPTPKPELVCGLTDFHVLAGFAPAEQTVALLRSIETPELAAHTELLAGQPDADGLRALFTTWITLPQQRIDELLPPVVAACAEQAAGGEFARQCRTVVELAEEHPHDAGVLAALLMNRITLRPGEALYLPAGNLHVYLRGVAVEILANSDNVLRGGLTPKHVDVPELLRVVDFRDGMPVLRPRPTSQPQLSAYPCAAEEFALSVAEWPGGKSGEAEDVRLEGGRPQILLCTRGTVLVRGERELKLPRGRSVWLPAGEPPVSLRPATAGERVQVFRATTG